jgi:DNA adenine methylase
VAQYDIIGASQPTGWAVEEIFVSSSSAPFARPFLKWAGGKSQLLAQIDQYLPEAIKDGSIQRYVEPFIGSGALFFHVVKSYPVQELYIADFNRELVDAYWTIQQCVEDLIAVLGDMQARYTPLSEIERKAFFYEKREQFNANRTEPPAGALQRADVERTAQLIFLNRTCYNGLYRVNAKGQFNVPFGRYKRPTICDAANLRAVAAVLQRTEIHFGHYTECEEFVDTDTMVYFDPLYRPISATARFTAYSQYSFDDKEQSELAEFYRKLNAKGATLLLSNSDPKNVNPGDDFFEDTYAGFHIERVQARRRINSRAERRGPIYELLIFNY